LISHSVHPVIKIPNDGRATDKQANDDDQDDRQAVYLAPCSCHVVPICVQPPSLITTALYLITIATIQENSTITAHSDMSVSSFGRAGQGEPEGASLAHLAADPHGAMVGFDNVFDNAES
jgi:hypothetical protein